VHLFDVINLYIFLYNFGQTLRWFDSPRFLKWLIIWNGGSNVLMCIVDIEVGLIIYLNTCMTTLLISCWWRASPERRNTTTVINKHAKQGGKVLSLFQMSHQCTLQGVFIGGVISPIYDYSFTPYTGHIPWIFPDMHVIFLLQCGCGTAQQGPQPQAVLFTPIDEDHGVYGPLVTLASPGLRLSSRSVPKNSEDCPPPRLLLASASVLLVSCLRAPSATGPKVIPPTSQFQFQP